MKRRSFGHVLKAGAIAAAFSGAPSTIHALATGGDPLAATLAAGRILLPDQSRAGPLVAAALPVHLGLSLGWAIVLARTLPDEYEVLWGTVGGAVIAVVDLGLVGRRYPAIAGLPLRPQIADHLAFGALVGWSLRRQRIATPMSSRA